MKRYASRFRFYFITILGLSALAGTANAAQVTRFKQKARALLTDFASHSDDGCISTLTSVSFTESVTNQDGTVAVGQPTTMIDIEYADACTGDVLSLSGGTTTQTVVFSGDVDGATLSAVVPVTDGVNNATVTLNLTFTGNADLQVSKTHFKTNDGTTTTVDKADVLSRTADVAGSIGTTLPLIAGPTAVELAQFNLDGTMVKSTTGERTVTKKN